MVTVGPVLAPRVLLHHEKPLSSTAKRAQVELRRGYELVTRWHGAPEAEPEPAMASTRQAPQQPRVCLALEFHDAVA